MGGGGKSGSASYRVADYYLSIQYGLCTDVDELLAIYCDEKELWSGSISTMQDVRIEKSTIFGGSKKEGGAVGTMTFLPGYADQVLTENLASRFGLSPLDCPASRGKATIFFTGDTLVENVVYTYVSPTGSVTTIGGANVTKATETSPGLWDIEVRAVAMGMIDDGHEGSYWGEYETFVTYAGCSRAVSYNWTKDGFLWGSNNPYLKGVWAKARRTPKTSLNPAYAKIVSTYTNTDGQTVEVIDANPAHIIFEALTNRLWGRGSPASGIDIAAYEYAAKVLYDEGLGLSLQWVKSDSVENFVGEIIKHINAVVYTSPVTGLDTIKLIRDDYDISNPAFVITPDNAVVTSFARTGWGETVNEMTVSWTNPENEENETVTVQDIGNITLQQQVVPDSRDYYAVRTSALATKLAERELRVASSPLAALQVEMNRMARVIVPGDVGLIYWPEHGLDGVVLRVSSVDYGKPGSPKITLGVSEDVFSLPTANYVDPPRTNWLDESEDPRPFDRARVVTLPYYAAKRSIGATEIATYDEDEVLAGILAAQDSRDTHAYDLWEEGRNAAGFVAYDRVARRTPLAVASLEKSLKAEARSVLSGLKDLSGEGKPAVGDFLWIGNDATPEDDMEIAIILAVSEVGYSLKRGVLDTLPRPWPAGTGAWLVKSGTFIHGPNVHAAFGTAEYKLTPQTSRGTLPIEQTPEVSGVLTQRPHLPFRPANVRIGGVSFQDVQVSSAIGAVPVTWARRNRLWEDAVILDWDSDDVPPESGQVTRIVVKSEDDAILFRSEQIIGTEYDLPVSEAWREQTIKIGVYAERGDLTSLSTYEINALVFTPPSFTLNAKYLTIGGRRVTISRAVQPLLPTRPVMVAGNVLYIKGKRVVIRDRDDVITAMGDAITFYGMHIVMR